MASKKSKKKRYIILSVVLVIVIVSGVMIFNATQSANTAQASGYEVISVSEQDMQLEIRGSGAVQSATQTDYYAPIAMQINEVLVENGSEVQAGDPIATVDSSMIQDRIDTINNNIAQVDSSIFALRFTKGSTTIKAPVKGTVKIINTNEGDSVEAVMSTSNTLIVISADDSMRISVNLQDASQFSEGDTVSITVDEEEIQSGISAIDLFEGTIEFVIEDDDYEVGQETQVSDVNGQSIGTGVMEINVPIYVSGSVGTVEDIHVEVDEEVSKNEKLITLEDDILSDDLLDLSKQKDDLLNELDDLYESLEAVGLGDAYTIYATQSGIVNELMVSDNATINQDMKLFSIQGTNPLEMQVAIDELEIAEVEIGQTAEVTFEALPGKKYEAEVTYINPLGQSINNVTSYYVTITFEEADDVLIGMSGNADIQSELKQGIVAIPLEAVQIIYDEYYVILGQDAAVKTVADHKITVGISDGTNIEVLDGLGIGDTVTIPVENQETGFTGFGGGRRDAELTD